MMRLPYGTHTTVPKSISVWLAELGIALIASMTWSAWRNREGASESREAAMSVMPGMPTRTLPQPPSDHTSTSTSSGSMPSMSSQAPTMLGQSWARAGCAFQGSVRPW